MFWPFFGTRAGVLTLALAVRVLGSRAGVTSLTFFPRFDERAGVLTLALAVRVLGPRTGETFATFVFVSALAKGEPYAFLSAGVRKRSGVELNFWSPFSLVSVSSAAYFTKKFREKFSRNIFIFLSFEKFSCFCFMNSVQIFSIFLQTNILIKLIAHNKMLVLFIIMDVQNYIKRSRKIVRF